MVYWIVLNQSKNNQCRYAKDIMLTDLITIAPSASIEDAQHKLKKHQLSGLPVTYEHKLIGIMTLTDLAKYNPV